VPDTNVDVSSLPAVSLPQLKCALEASWDRSTAYLRAEQSGNAALGQCYPTSRVVQWFFPHLEIASGAVDTGSGLEAHFWNIDPAEPSSPIDLTWQQFADGSRIMSFEILDRHALNDSPQTLLRCRLLLARVLRRLETLGAPDELTINGGAGRTASLAGRYAKPPR
jgi:hypothetical protein